MARTHGILPFHTKQSSVSNFSLICNKFVNKNGSSGNTKNMENLFKWNKNCVCSTNRFSEEYKLSPLYMPI